MTELADVADLKFAGRNTIRVRFPFVAPFLGVIKMPELRLQKVRDNYKNCCTICLQPINGKISYNLNEGEACGDCFDKYIDEQYAKLNKK